MLTSFSIYSQNKCFTISSTADSALIVDKFNKPIVQLLWSNNTFDTTLIKICVSVIEDELLLPSENNLNYSLAPSIKIEIEDTSKIQYVYNILKIRYFNHNSNFELLDLNNFANVFIQRGDTNYIHLNSKEVKENYVEYYLYSLKHNDIYFFNATNILFGNYYKGSSISFNNDVLTPKGYLLSFYPGIKISSNNNKIFVNGNVNAYGNINEPINIENTSFQLNGDNDSTISNNNLIGYFDYTDGINSSIIISSGNLIVNNSRLRTVFAQNRSNAKINKTILQSAGSNESKLYLFKTEFDSTGDFRGNNSIIFVDSCLFKYWDSESNISGSLVNISNTTIYADAFSNPIKPINSFITYEGNYISFSGEPEDNGNRRGIGIWQNTYAIIRNNILIGLEIGITIGYSNKATIYNNTFVNNRQGIYVYATPNTVSIYNNIFYNHYTAINLNFSTYSGGTNVSYINYNLWHERNPQSVVPYIDNRTENSIIVGDSISYHADPLFSDMFSYELSSISPAIDQGTVSIPTPPYLFSVLDTTVVVGDNIQLTNFGGSFPDIGAKEYSPPTFINSTFLPSEIKLYQNYPNPFNPRTTIKYSLKKKSFVKIKIFDILGKEVVTLVNEEKDLGNHKTSFDATNLSSGVYFYKLKTHNFIDIKKMILLK